MIRILFILVFLPFSLTANSGYFFSYSIHPDSWISIEGTTNVNSFECTSGSDIPRGYIVAESHPAGNSLLFSDAVLELEVSSFDCNNRKMNRDLQKALGSPQYPYVKIHLEKAEVLDGETDGDDKRLKVDVVIVLNGVSRKNQLIIDLDQKEGYRYLFTGQKELNMSDFNIDPPSPALGLIKVHDDILINFNLIIEANMISEN